MEDLFTYYSIIIATDTYSSLMYVLHLLPPASCLIPRIFCPPLQNFDPLDVMHPKGMEPPSEFKRCIDIYQVCVCDSKLHLFDLIDLFDLFFSDRRSRGMNFS